MNAEAAGGVTVHAALARATLLATVSTSPRLDCQLLLAEVLGVDRSKLYTGADRLLSRSQQAAYEQLIGRRAAGEPVAYLLGRREFRGLDFEVNAATLVPRPETELVVDIALEALDHHTGLTIADLGTGSGAIAVALARECPCWQLIASDTSWAALAVAQRNVARWTEGNVALVQQRWLAGFSKASLDAIVTNPPYVAEGDPRLEALRFEPGIALTAGPDGLAAIRDIIGNAARALRAGGLIIIEHGFDQGQRVQAMLGQAGFTAVESAADLAGHLRVTRGERA